MASAHYTNDASCEQCDTFQVGALARKTLHAIRRVRAAHNRCDQICHLAPYKLRFGDQRIFAAEVGLR